MEKPIYVKCVYEHENQRTRVVECTVDGGWIHAQRIMLTGKPNGEGWKLVKVEMVVQEVLELEG